MNQNTKAANSKDDAYYKQHHQIVMKALASMDITIEDGMLKRPLTLKVTIEDATLAIINYLAKNQLPQISKQVIVGILTEWIGSFNRQIFSELQAAIKYNPSAPNRWDEVMEITFGRLDDCDRWALKHQIWCMKRHILGMEVSEKHRPMLLNIFGAPDQGKTLFFNAYLLNVLPKSFVKEINDMSVCTDERHFGIYGANIAIIFTEAGKGEKTNVEQLKNIIDRVIFTQRVLGHNCFNNFKGNSTLLSTSNRRIKEFLKEENPRKWYEIEFPTRTIDEVLDYVRRRDEIPVAELWQCINENEPSELMQNWDKVHSRILATCAYVPLVEKWILHYIMDNGGPDLIGKHISLWTEYTADTSNKKDYMISADKFKAKAENLGLTYCKKNGRRGYFLNGEGYNLLAARYEQVFGRLPFNAMHSTKEDNEF